MSNKKEKRIELCKMRVGDIKFGFGNPRKITRPKRDELRQSMEKFGDFGVVVIDENDNVIAGNIRVEVQQEIDPDRIIDCKRLIGYTEKEKKIINIKANQHAGEWDIDALLDFTMDLTDIDLGEILPDDKNPIEEKKELADMELKRFEKYNYLLIVFRNEMDYKDAVYRLGLEGKKLKISNKKTVKARAVWYDEFVEKWD